MVRHVILWTLKDEYSQGKEKACRPNVPKSYRILYRSPSLTPYNVGCIILLKGEERMDELCRTFIELPLFSKRWSEIGLGEDELLALQIFLLKDPESGPVMEGTGGIRKDISYNGLYQERTGKPFGRRKECIKETG